MRRLSPVLMCLAAWCAPLAAADGLFEINQDCVDSGCFPGDTPGFPVTLPSGGAYRLTSNLTVNVASSGITVQTADRVDLDLGGFTISGGGSCTGTPVTACTPGNGVFGINSTAVANVRVHHGTVSGFGSANIFLTQLLDGSSVENLLSSESTNNGFASISVSVTSTGRTVVIRDVTTSRNRGFGLLSGGTSGHFDIDRLVATGNGGIGASLGTGATVRNSSFHRNGGLGLSSTQVVALGNSTFFSNNGSSTAAQFSITTLLNMGGVVCEDASCP